MRRFFSSLLLIALPHMAFALPITYHLSGSVDIRDSHASLLADIDVGSLFSLDLTIDPDGVGENVTLKGFIGDWQYHDTGTGYGQSEFGIGEYSFYFFQSTNPLKSSDPTYPVKDGNFALYLSGDEQFITDGSLMDPSYFQHGFSQSYFTTTTDNPIAYCPQDSCGFYLDVQEMTYDVPEPSSLSLLGLSVLGLLAMRRSSTARKFN